MNSISFELVGTALSIEHMGGAYEPYTVN